MPGSERGDSRSRSRRCGSQGRDQSQGPEPRSDPSHCPSPVPSVITRQHIRVFLVHGLMIDNKISEKLKTGHLQSSIVSSPPTFLLSFQEYMTPNYSLKETKIWNGSFLCRPLLIWIANCGTKVVKVNEIININFSNWKSSSDCENHSTK